MVRGSQRRRVALSSVRTVNGFTVANPHPKSSENAQIDLSKFEPIFRCLNSECTTN
jgi:hypothetical protein